jgi:hypothetical protein
MSMSPMAEILVDYHLGSVNLWLYVLICSTIDLLELHWKAETLENIYLESCMCGTSTILVPQPFQDSSPLPSQAFSQITIHTHSASNLLDESIMILFVSFNS